MECEDSAVLPLLMVRHAALPTRDDVAVEVPPAGESQLAWLSHMWADPDIRRGVATASPSLAASIERFDELPSKRRRSAVLALWKYVNRMTFRPTPFEGLAEVIVACTAPGSGRSVVPPPAAAQSAWEVPGPVSGELKPRYVASPWLEYGGGSVGWLPSAGEQRAGGLSTRRIPMSAPVRQVLDAATTPMTVDELVHRLSAAAGQKGSASWLRLIGSMIDNGLLSCVPHDDAGRPSPGPVDGSAGQTGPDVCPDARCGADLVISDSWAAMGKDVLRAVEATSIPDSYPSQLQDFSERFATRFGIAEEVPVLEVLSNISGLGISRRVGAALTEELGLEHHVLLGELLNEALSSDSLYVLPDQAWLARMADLRRLAGDQRPSCAAVDVTFSVVQGSPWTTEKVTATLGRAGVNRVGHMTGRFLPLLNDSLRERFCAQIRESCAAPDVITAEIRYGMLPGEERYGSLFADCDVRSHRLALTPMPPSESIIDIDVADVVLGRTEGGALYLRWTRTGELLDITQNSMVRYSHAPNLARFLLEVSEHQYAMSRQMYLGSFARHPFFPGVHLGSSLVSRPRWFMPQEAAGGAAGDSIVAWMDRWRVPDLVSVRAIGSDQALVLDRSTPAALDVLVKELASSRLGLVFEDVLIRLGGGPVISADGHSVESELVVTVCRQHDAPHGADRTSAEPISSSDGRRLVPLFQREHAATMGRCSLRVFMPPVAIDHFVIDELPKIPALGGAIEDIWWLRSTAGEPHIRVDLPNKAVNEKVLALLNEWEMSLHAAGYSLQPYRPEPLRYGGGSLLPLAQRVFIDDSIVVRSLLIQGERELRRSRVTRQAASLASTIALAEAMIPQSVIPAVVEDMTVERPEGGELFRVVGRQVLDAVVDHGGPLGPYVSLMHETKLLRVAKDYSRQMADVHRLGSPNWRRGVESVLSLHLNRIGVTAIQEREVVGAWRRVLERRMHEQRLRPGGRSGVGR